MKADDLRRMAAFMEYDVKKAEQSALDERFLTDEAGRLSRDCTVMTFLGPMALRIFEETDGGKIFDLYDGKDGELRSGEQKTVADADDMQRVVITRSVLLKLLEPMTSDFVILKVAKDYPVKIVGEIGESCAAAYIAPRVGE